MRSSELIPFAFDGRSVRVMEDEEGNPWFVAKDICRVLDIANPHDAVGTLDEDEKGVAITDPLSAGGRQEVRTISESGLYGGGEAARALAACPCKRTGGEAVDNCKKGLNSLNFSFRSTDSRVLCTGPLILKGHTMVKTLPTRILLRFFPAIVVCFRPKLTFSQESDYVSA